MKGKVNRLNTKITKHVNDIIQKYANALFRNATLEFYGIKTAPIIELINPELPTVEVSMGVADVVFLLKDDTYLHFAFETGNNRAALIKCAGYDLRLFERDGRLLHTVVIYTADVKEKPSTLNIGSLTYKPNIILMCEYDGNAIFSELKAKIKTKQELTDVDMLNLVLLPLMKNIIPRWELAANSIGLAQTIPDTTKRNACIAAAFAFASKYLDEHDIEKIMGVIRMTDLGTMLVMDERIQIAKNALREGATVVFTKKITGLDETVIQRLQEELNNE